MFQFFSQFKFFFKLLFLIALSAFCVYYIPAQFNRLLFLLLLIPIWKSKNDFFWFAFILILIETPGGLFSGGTAGDPYRLPLYTLFPKVSFGFQEIYFILILLKGLIKKQGYLYRSFTYRKQYSILGILLILLIIMSLMLGMSFDSLRNTYKSIISISLYVSTIFVFKNEEDIINFFKTIFPFAFIAIILQLYWMAYNQQLFALFKPGITITQGELSGELKRPIELGVVLLFCFFGSFLYSGNKARPFSNVYLLVINITCFISILMAATRSWFLGFTITYFFYFYLNYKKLGKNVIAVVIALGFFLIIIFMIPQIRTQVNAASKRLATIEELAAGDLTAGGTLSRLTERGPRVMEGFKTSTIILGAGYSDLYFEYADGHVGFQNILLQSGIIGFTIIISFALTLFFTPLRIIKKFSYRVDLRPILRNLPLLIPAVLTINSGTQFWGYGIDTSRVMLLAFYFTVSSIYIQSYLNPTYAEK